ncbi:hypothetical protein JS44_12810 [Anoxybacillus flavithermus]|uniref:Uncharacterized protein n=1 Tax=Anoxybacillus flavithermus TaxID=33934 RepID=A0A094JIB0_9BACL|nr:hypothetical protein JS44_12810 [Anoxybacillus flavithermus]
MKQKAKMSTDFTTVWIKDEVFAHVGVFWKKADQRFLVYLIARLVSDRFFVELFKLFVRLLF